MSAADALVSELGRAGYVHLRGPFDRRTYHQLAESLGEVIAHEQIALRPGAHAYVAKPGRVPLHTDHPEVQVIGWHCEEQDPDDGTSLLFDTAPVVAGLAEEERAMLHRVELWCPPLAGGPPTLRFPVLRSGATRPRVFCSPWLHAANPAPEHQAALDDFRQRISGEARKEVREIRLAQGDALFVDNQRVLHGRRAIAEGSRRRLHRVWVRRPG